MEEGLIRGAPPERDSGGVFAADAVRQNVVTLMTAPLLRSVGGELESAVHRAASVLDISSAMVSGLARYWDRKRGRRSMPTWADIDPAEIKPLLPHLMVTRYERNPFRVRYVLVGTWVVQYSGADFTGRYLDELEFASEVDTDWEALHQEVATQGLPIMGQFRFLSESGLEREYEAAILPIADESGRFVERGLCIEDFPDGVTV